MKWKNFSIQTKILLIGFNIILSFILVITFYIVPLIEKTVYDMKEEKIKDVVDMTVSTISGMHEEYKNGTLSIDEFQANAINYIKQIRYGTSGKDYLWINDLNCRMIIHPLRSDLNGTDMTDYADPTGKKFFQEMVDICKKSGSGYVSYMWQYNDNKDQIEDKISYVKSIPEIDWIVGTGVYKTDVKSEIAVVVTALKKNLTIVLTFITVILIAIILLVSRKIRSNINLCVEFGKNLAQGNLKTRINIKQTDEIGILADTLNTSADNLEQLVRQNVKNARALTTIVEEIAGGNDNLSQMTSEQASALEEIAQSIEETLSGTVNNAQNAIEVDSMSKLAAQTAQNGSDIVFKVIDSIGQINESGQKIREIITLINEIAFQTNLLALNAAVEAARAGDQGKSFAVVASEVRNLAQRSAAAAKQIELMIGDSINVMLQATELGHAGRNALKDIVNSISSVSSRISEIAAASEQQKYGIEQISFAIEQIDKVTQQNSALVEETATISGEMANQAVEMKNSAEKFLIND
ncbi:MAG: cache domain-containing protein [Spirochaetes bacterium]|nr:cache domain-containing protein [Spirochaetota bacterium]